MNVPRAKITYFSDANSSDNGIGNAADHRVITKCKECLGLFFIF